MKKKIKDLTFVEIKRICEKHIIYNRMLCKYECSKDCPLLMKTNKMVIADGLNVSGAFHYTEESCCVNFKESDLSNVDIFMNKKVKVEE